MNRNDASARTDEVSPQAQEQNQAEANENAVDFPIVAIGASAGGLGAFETFFGNLPDQPGMAFVLIQHLDPNHESELAEILQNHTKMPVTQAENRDTIQVNRVYVIPPGQSLSIENHTLHLSEPEEPRGRRAPIDLFFRSLADAQGENAVCVIFSGTGGDGSVGLKRIKERGGVVLVQSPEDAEYEGMPRNAIKTGMADMSAPVGELAQKLIEYRRSAAQIEFPGAADNLPDDDADALQRIFTQLQHKTGADFSQYKRSTILRRLQRRMQVTQSANLNQYLELLRRDHAEARSLFQEFLISVTNFFRDAEVWQTLEEEVIPALFEEKGRGDSIRVWVPGCATGEEAYTLGILLLEEARRRQNRPDVQLFATDLNENALAFARRGLYPQAIAADLSQERLERFFEVEGDSYRVRPSLQEIVLFAEHNLVKDAPFAHLDLISCRNLLIYLERDIQKRVFQIFRYGLGKGGYLFLGSSESAEQAYEMFEPVHKRERIYYTRPGKPPLPNLPVIAEVGEPEKDEPAYRRAAEKEKAAKNEPSLGDVHRNLMLARYAPPSVLVGEDYEIRYKFGQIGRYLRHQEGEASLNLLDNVSEQIRIELRTGLYAAFRRREAARPRRVQLTTDGQREGVQLRIEPVPSSQTGDEALALVIFEPLSEPDDRSQEKEKQDDVDAAMVEQMEEELKEVRHRLQTTVEEYETSNEELKSSNEELQSMNEELRSTTEELETSREELTSTNEELTSVNQELKAKIEELKRANSDLENLMEATDIATLFLDRELCLQRYTPKATQLFNIIPADIGRPFAHISHKIDHGALPGLAKQVLDSLEKVEEEVPSHDGRWFLLEMRPYRTVEDKIDGVIVTLVEITAQVEAERQQRVTAKRQAALASLGQQALQGTAVLDLIDLAVRQAAQTLDAPLAHVFAAPDAASQQEGEELLLVAGVGWERSQIGKQTLPGGSQSQAGYALEINNGLLVSDRAEERRFHQAEALQARDVRSGLSVVIRDIAGVFGVLEAYKQEPKAFDEGDLDFLRTIANVIGTAVARRRAEETREKLLKRVEAERRRLEIVLQQMPAGVVIAEAPGGRLLMGNDRVEEIWRQSYRQVETVMEYAHYPGFHRDGTPLAPEEWPLARAIAGGEVVKGEEIIIERGDGTRGVIANSAAPIHDETGEIVAGVVIFQDVTERRKTEAERDRLLQELQSLTATLEERVKARTEELRRRSEQLSAIASALTVAEQRERERIAQILHDDLQQLLHAAQMRVILLEADLDRIEDEPIWEQVQELGQIHEKALDVALSLTVELSPPVLEGGGLAEAFAWLAGHMKNAYGLHVEVVADKSETTDPVGADLRELVFQMVRELLFNVVKHSGVDAARLILQKQDGRCLITVADEGSGFKDSHLQEKEAEGIGYGLSSIRERLDLFDGAMTVETAPGAGTRITLIVPCRPNE